MLMADAGLKWIARVTAVAFWIGATGMAAVPASPSVIPEPARVDSRPGSFAIRAGTEISIPRDPRAARVARYFADLLQTTRGMRLAAGSSGAERASHAIVFGLNARAGASSPEAYAIDISPDRIRVSAGDPRGLLYGAVTLWQLCTSGEVRGDSAVVPSMRITDSPRFAWR